MTMSTSESDACRWIGVVEEALRTRPAGVTVGAGSGVCVVFFDSAATPCTF